MRSEQHITVVAEVDNNDPPIIIPSKTGQYEIDFVQRIITAFNRRCYCANSVTDIHIAQVISLYQ